MNTLKRQNHICFNHSKLFSKKTFINVFIGNKEHRTVRVELMTGVTFVYAAIAK